MKNIVFLLIFLMPVFVCAQELQQSEKQLIDNAGIPYYSDAKFVYGNADVGFRFVTSDSPENVRKWYQEKLPEWSLYTEYGAWILHNGNTGAKLAEVMSQNQVSIKYNENLPEWHSLDKDVTTEIVFMVVE